MSGTPSAIGFPEPVLPPVHVPDWRLFDEKTARVICLRCRVMVSANQWSGEICPGEPKDPRSPEPPAAMAPAVLPGTDEIAKAAGGASPSEAA